ncbi:MAG TPA: N-acetylglucosamine-6-phosphate deacetylase [Ktedonobacterales bacterium]|nr:N-acetylglucosamine-6-phosphate deacetylase [Ktedonobacterales bacterium]
MRLTLRGARLVDALSDRPAADLVIEAGKIRAAGRVREPLGPALDVAGLIVTPGFIDVHTHGGGGCNLHTTDAEEIVRYGRWAAGTGTTGFLIAVVGVADGLPAEQLRAATVAITASVAAPAGAEALGIHLEGPYISPQHRGAHALAWLRTPNADETETLLRLAAGHLRLITLAPELPGAAALIERLAAAGVRVSIGHTDATYEQAQQAIGLGATHTTHCFNAMRPLRHRDPGPLGAVVEAERVYGELIADGVHVHPAVMRVLLRALGADRTVIVTDAQAAAGDAGATFEFAGQPAHVAGGAVRLRDGTIAGSVLTMDQALRNVLRLGGVTLSAAVGMLSLNPARVAGVAERKGQLRAGYDADVLLFDEGLTLQATYCRGAVAFATDAWRERLASI